MTREHDCIAMSVSEYREHERDNTGVCMRCGCTQSQAEPDAQGYECIECGACDVYSVVELLNQGYVTIV